MTGQTSRATAPTLTCPKAGQQKLQPLTQTAVGEACTQITPYLSPTCLEQIVVMDVLTIQNYP
jgi:hypothetical protein